MATSRNAAQFVARFNRKMALLPKGARDTITKTFATEAARIVLQMRGRIRKKSGVAASTIRAEPHKRFDLAVRITAGGKATQKMPRTIGLESMIKHAIAGKPVKPWDYVRGLEFGTKPHINGGLFAGSRHPGSRPFPFFHATAKAGKKRARAVTKTNVKNIIRTIAGQ